MFMTRFDQFLRNVLFYWWVVCFFDEETIFFNTWVRQVGFPVNFLEIWIQLLVTTFRIKIYFFRCKVYTRDRTAYFGHHYLVVIIAESLSNLTLHDSWGVPYRHEVQYVWFPGWGVNHLHQQIGLESV